MDAESSYLFRHAILRDAAYQLQLPGDRARLHALVVEIVEALSGGRPREPVLEPGKDGEIEPHPTDLAASELAQHARFALESAAGFAACYRVYLHRSAILLARMHSHEQASQSWKTLAALLDGADAAECTRRAAILLHRSGKPKLAETLLHEAIAQAQGARSARHEAAALGNLGTVLLQSGRATIAHEPMLSALALIPGDTDPYLRASVLNSLGAQRNAVGLQTRAKEAYREALEIRRRIGHLLGIATTLGNMAILLHSESNVEPARPLAQEALEICRRINHREQEGNTLSILASLCEHSGKYDEASEITRSALVLQRETGNRRGESASWSRLGVALFDEDPVQAEAAFSRALALQTESEEFGMAASTLNNLANLCMHNSQLDRADACFGKGLKYARASGNRSAEGVLLGSSALLCRLRGDLPRAIQSLERALLIHRELANIKFVGLHSCDLAICQLGQGEQDKANSLWLEGIAILQDIGDSSALDEKNTMMLKACKEYGAEPLGH